MVRIFKWNIRTSAALFWAAYTIGTIVAAVTLCRQGLFTHWHPIADPKNFTWDPEGYYLGAGISLFFRPLIKIEDVCLHPGLPLVFLIQGVARLLHGVALLFGDTSEFYEYTAQHFRLFVSGVTVAMAFVHLLAAYTVYRVAMRLTDRFIVGVAAVFAYTTSICVFARFIHYNPERFTTIFNLLAVLWAVNYAESALRGNYKRAYAWIFLSGLAVMGAFVSKFYCAMHMLALIPFLVLVWRRDGDRTSTIPVRTRLVAIALFGAAVAACFWLASLKMSWEEFFQAWFHFAPGTPTYESGQNWILNFVSKSGAFVIHGFQSLAKQSKLWLPGTPGNWFTPVELNFLIFGTIGYFVYLYVKPEKRRLAGALGLAVVLAYPTTTYAGCYPYVQFAIGIFAAFFAFLAVFVQDKALGKRLPDALKCIVALALVGCVHYGAVRATVRVLDSQLRQYRSIWAAYYDAMEYAAPDGRIALRNAHDITHIVGTVDWWSYTGSPFSTALRDRFVVLSGKESAEDLYGARVRAIVERDAKGATHWNPLARDYTRGDAVLEAAVEQSPPQGVPPRTALQLLQAGAKLDALRAVSSAAQAYGDPIRYLRNISHAIRPEYGQLLWPDNSPPGLIVADFGAANAPGWVEIFNDQQRPILHAGLDPQITGDGNPSAFIEVGEPQTRGGASVGVLVDIPLNEGKVGVLFWVRAEHPDDVLPVVCIAIPALDQPWFTNCIPVAARNDGWRLFKWEGNAMDFARSKGCDPAGARIKAVGVNLKGPANRIWLDSISTYLP